MLFKLFASPFVHVKQVVITEVVERPVNSLTGTWVLRDARKKLSFYDELRINSTRNLRPPGFDP